MVPANAYAWRGIDYLLGISDAAEKLGFKYKINYF
jgi:hypothetical protein